MESVSTCLLLLVGNSAATTTSGLGVLTTDTQAEVVADTTVGFDLLQAFQVVTQLRVDVVRQELAALTVDNVALPVEEPRGDLELGRVLQNGNNALKLVRVELTGTLAKVDIGLLANNVGVSAANTLDLSEGVLHLDLAVNVGVEQTVCVNPTRERISIKFRTSQTISRVDKQLDKSACGKVRSEAGAVL